MLNIEVQYLFVFLLHIFSQSTLKLQKFQELTFTIQKLFFTRLTQNNTYIESYTLLLGYNKEIHFHSSSQISHIHKF